MCSEALMAAAESSAAHGSFHEDLGIWTRISPQPPIEVRPALFLDRDGVIVQDPGYLSRVDDLALIPGAAAQIGRASCRERV